MAAAASSSSSSSNPAADTSGMDQSQRDYIQRQIVRQLTNMETNLRGRIDEVKQSIKEMVVSTVDIYKFYNNLPSKTSDHTEKLNKQVEDFRQAVLGCVETAASIELQMRAVNKIKGTFGQPNLAELPNVGDALEAEAERLKAEEGDVDLETHAIYLNYWKSKVEGAARASVNVGDGIELVNEDEFGGKCPLTLIPILELTDPVKNSRCKHIYSKQAILGYLGRKRELPCPTAGCVHKVSKSSIKDDPKLVEDIAFAKQSQRPVLDSQRNQGEFMDLAEEDEES